MAAPIFWVKIAFDSNPDISEGKMLKLVTRCARNMKVKLVDVPDQLAELKQRPGVLDKADGGIAVEAQQLVNLVVRDGKRD
ncbi:hypothetical protein BDZ91DRAFT_801761 [Kalaharituber pfeilii]|nr:hypothetical protein BDZ91DRAFT_801761 [Kalaharituber pfeilii]